MSNSKSAEVMPIAREVADILARQNVSARLVSFHTVKPLDLESLQQIFEQCKVVATLEEHSVVGGFGAAVAEWLADRETDNARLIRFGTPDQFLHEAGSQEHARRVFGLTSESISKKLLESKALDLSC